MTATTTPPAPDPKVVEQVNALADAVADALVTVNLDQGEELSLTEQVRRIRLRHQLVPYPVIAALWAGAAAATQHPAGGLIAAGTALVLAVVWWVAWGRVNKVTRREQRRWRTTVVISATGWLLWAAAAGAGGVQAAVLWAAGYALAWPYWRRHRIPIPPEAHPEPEPEPVTLVAEDGPAPVATIAQRWAARVATKSAPGSYLTDHREVKTGEEYTVVLDGVHQHVDQFLVQLKAVGSALSLREGELALDRHPSKRFDLARLLLLDPARNPLLLKNDYPGPVESYDPATGLIRVGVHADLAVANWALWRKGWGACSGCVFGATGTGKSRMLDTIVCTCAYTRLMLPWIADPKDGSSMPAWAARADWSATTPEEVLNMLRAAVRVIEVRTLINTLLGRSNWDITPDTPGLLMILDECHKAFNHAVGWMTREMAEEAVGYAVRIAREGRSAGVGLICATQYPGLPSFGNDASLRDNLLAGNGAAYHIPSNQAQQLIPGLETSPKDIPHIPGVGCMVGEEATNLPYRGWWLPDDQVEALAAAAPLTPLDRATAGALGDLYAGRHARRAAVQQAQLAQLDAHDPELVATILAARPDLAAAFRTRTASPTRPATTAASTGSPRAVVLRLARPPQLILPNNPTPDPDKPRRRTAQDWVYELVRGGTRSPGELQAVTGYSEAHVRNTLNALVEAGRIRRAGHGRYEPAA